MNRPQQIHVDGADNMPSGELSWEPLANGKYRVRYRRIDGVTMKLFVGSAEETEAVFFKCKEHLAATARGDPPPPLDIPTAQPDAKSESSRQEDLDL